MPSAFTFLHSATLFLAFRPYSALDFPRLSPSSGGLRATLRLATADIVRCSTLYPSTDWTSIHFLGATPFLLYWSSPCATKSRNTENQTRWLLYIIPLVQNKTRQLFARNSTAFRKNKWTFKNTPTTYHVLPSSLSRNLPIFQQK